MAHVRVVVESEASASVAEDCAFIASSYSKILGERTKTPQVYRASSSYSEPTLTS